MLDDSSVSFCSYKRGERICPMSAVHLSAAIKWTMKENLEVQFMYPDYDLDNEIERIIDSVSHVKVMSCNNPKSSIADIVVVDGLTEILKYKSASFNNFIVKVSFKDLKDAISIFSSTQLCSSRINFMFTDRCNFVDADIHEYKDSLLSLKEMLISNFKMSKRLIQTNLLTDRLFLTKMNNCNAGIESITIAPDGKFYVCPAFYQNGHGNSNGSVLDGLSIENQYLLDIAHAPICFHCDAYQCYRCVWDNQQSTLEVNTPSRGQCVSSHIERQVSQLLLHDLHELGFTFEGLVNDLSDVDYIDPFENRKNWN